MKASKSRERRLLAEQRDTVRALVLSMPVALALHYKSLRHCMEASVVGSRILRAHGIEARPVPCVARASDGRSCNIVAGYTRDELLATYGGVQDFIGNASLAFHVAIEARAMAGRLLIDLTLGQMIPTVAIAMPLDFPLAERWPTVAIGEWRVEYDPSPREALVKDEISKAQAVTYDGLQGDVEALMHLAKHVRCNREKFYMVLLAQQRDLMMQFLRVAESGAWSLATRQAIEHTRGA